MLSAVLSLLCCSESIASALVVPAATVKADEYAASFKNTDINEFIQVVGRNLGKTIIIDPNVRVKIDVRSYDVMNEKQYYQFFLNVLEVYGFAVDPKTGNLLETKVTPASMKAPKLRHQELRCR